MSERASCCADFYAQDWVTALLPDGFHPGGLETTRRLIDALDLPEGSRVLDLGCGSGNTVVQLAARGHRVVAVDYGEALLQRTRRAVAAAGLDGRVEIVAADATALPLDAACVHAAICECALSTFSDKAAVASELRRVLRPGGRIGISDMAVTTDLPAELRGVAGPWACLSDALDVEGYQRLFLDAGLRVLSCVDESSGMRELILDLKRKLLLAGLGSMAGALEAMSLDVAQARHLLDLARTAVDRGALQYAAMTFGLATSPAAVTETTDQAAVSCEPGSGCC